MKLMVSVFFVEGTFLFRQNEKTQHIFFWYGLHFIQQEALKTFFSQKMLLRIWRQHPLCFGDVVSRTERCILYDGRPFDLRTYRLETEAGSKLTQLGLMARCRQIMTTAIFCWNQLAKLYCAQKASAQHLFLHYISFSTYFSSPLLF